MKIIAVTALVLALLWASISGGWLADSRTVERYFESSPRRFAGRPVELLPADWHSQRGEAKDLSSSEALQALRDLSTLATEDADPDRRAKVLGTLGLLYLNVGELNKAVSHLKTAAGLAPDPAEPQANLALAYLTRYDEGGAPADLLEALRGTLVALRSRPASPAIHFDYALILARLHLRHEAIAAFRTFLDLEPASPWAAEARIELERLEAATSGERWAELRKKIEDTAQPPSREQVEELVQASPFKSRVWVEQDLLGRWANAGVGSPEAESLLAMVEQIAEILARDGRSPMLMDCVRAIAATEGNRNTRRRDLLAAGHATYSRAQQLYEAQDIKQAEPLFAQSSAQLAAAGSPLHLWADFYQAVCVYYRDASAAQALFETQFDKLRGSGYDDLLGRLCWLLGTVAGVQENPETSLELHRRGFELLDGSIGRSGSGFLMTNQAEALGRLGEIDESWRKRLQSLEWSQDAADRRRIHGGLVESLQMLARQGLTELAEPFLLELQANAAAWNNPMAEAEAWLQEARGLVDRARAGEAAAILAKAQQAVKRVPPGSIRDQLQLGVDGERGRSLAHSRPQEGVDLLTSTLEGWQRLSNRFDRIRLLVTRSDAFRDLGNREAAEHDLEEAIREYEALRQRTGDEGLRILAFGQAQKAFDRYLEFLLEDGASPERILEVAERSRARFLLDIRMGVSAKDSAPTSFSASAFEELPGRTKVVLYSVLPQKLLIWLADSGNLKLEPVAVQAEHLESLVANFRNEIELGGEQETIQAAGRELAKVLLGPFADELREAEEIVFIPDRFLQRVPFMALPHPATERLLLEDATLSLAPSATLLFQSLAGDDRPFQATNVLAIGDPAFDIEAFPNLPRLEKARQEARRVAALYRESRLLEDAEATETKVLEELENFDVLHFAGHAQADAISIRWSRLLLAPEAGGRDGRLHAFELPRKLERTSLVVLAACHSLDSTGRDREDLFGIASAFLAAGPRHVIAGLWNSSDRPTARLMFDLHRRIAAGAAPPEALRQTLLAGSRRGLEAADWAQFEILTRLQTATKGN